MSYMSDNRKDLYLEPRVAKLEVGMERLTDDVRNLAVVVREQGSQMEGEIQKLVVAVTQASGPRKTDWSTIFAGIMLVLAIGSAVFWPLNQQVTDNKIQLDRVENRLIEADKQIFDKYEREMNAREKLLNSQYSLIDSKLIKTQEKNDLYIEKLWGRIQVLENEYIKNNDLERNELMLWRQKSMGLSTPDASTTLTTIRRDK